MVVIELTGGLGNQLFQYAFGRSLTIGDSNELYFDVQKYKWDNLRGFSLNSYQIPYKIVDQQDLMWLHKKSFLGQLINRYKPYYKLHLIEEKTFEFDCNFNLFNRKLCFYKGYWQSERYFSEIRKTILQDLKITTPLSSETQFHLNKIKKNKNSVSIHIRRGDYVNDLKTNNFHGALDLSYYYKSIEFFRSKFENPTFFIFSDDKEFVKKTFSLESNFEFIQDVKLDYEELFLMSQCENNIIANSSFSWWGAWLNENEHKIVVSPNNWFKNEAMQSQTKDLIPQNWIKI